jgi:multicomponent Na+:H+ antiporter subunit D
MLDFYIILQLLLPLFIATLLLLTQNKKISYIITTITSGILTITSFVIVYYSYFNEHRYFFGGWLPPLGIELLINFTNSIMLSLISSAAFLTLFLGYNSFFHQRNINHSSFCSLLLIALTGTFGIVITNDFFNLYVFIEIASIALYALTAIGSTKATESAFNYLVIGTIAAIIILMGIGFLYSASGTLNIDHFISLTPKIKQTSLLAIGSCLIIVGLALKASLFPLHTWLLDLYTTTNNIILPFLSAVSTKIYVFLLIKMAMFILPISNIMINTLSVLAIIGAIITSLAATQQKTLRGILAYSSLTNLCYIFLILNIQRSLEVALLLIVSHSLVKLSLFILTNYIIETKKTNIIKSLNALFFEMPLIVVLFIINSASLIGIPFTLGFISKFYLLIELIKNHHWTIIASILFSSFIGLTYFWKTIETMIATKETALIPTPPLQRNYVIEYGVLILTLINILIGIAFIYAPFNFQFK